MVVRIDTREKTPWVFPDGVKTVVSKVNNGDYAVDGDNCFSIERKSAQDFRGTLVKEWDRFCRELLRMHLAGFSSHVIIVESDFADFCWSTGNDGELVEPANGADKVFTPKFAAERIAELHVFYRTSVLFAHDAGMAAALAFQILLQRNAQMKIAAKLPKFN